MAGDQHARARRVPDAQRRQGILQADAALDHDVGGDLAGAPRAREIGGAARGQEDLRVGRLDAADEVDLLQRRARGMRRAGRLERRPELRADAAFAQARNIGVALLVHARQIVGEDVAARLGVSAG